MVPQELIMAPALLELAGQVAVVMQQITILLVATEPPILAVVVAVAVMLLRRVEMVAQAVPAS